MCGEHAYADFDRLRSTGSSPRVRGTPSFLHTDSFVLRIIPACAGNTGRNRDSCGKSRDHPRVCGEHDRINNNGNYEPGSSPRVRGTQLTKEEIYEILRIIPACAGNTRGAGKILQKQKDHPRVCGEHILGTIFCTGLKGSSPRVRGTPNARPEVSVHLRIIPACAGNTYPFNHKWRHGQDHPRVCGEHCVWLFVALAPQGSSPRVRGTLIAWNCCILPLRIIPACAGNTA